jgi:ribosomal protein L40E
MEVCRLCGQKKIYYKDITKSEHHVLLIKKLFKITIEENDTNKSVCEECYKSSVSFAIKRKQAQKMEKILEENTIMQVKVIQSRIREREVIVID